jgi:hypothetical protein
MSILLSVFSAAKQVLDYVTGFAIRALTRCGSGSNDSGCGLNVQAGRFSNKVWFLLEKINAFNR